MWDFACLIADFKRKPFQAFINSRFSDARKIILDKEQISIIVTKDGDAFRVSPDIGFVSDVYRDYRFDMHPTDIVIDIGANIGSFALPAARMAAHVYAIEPITINELRENIRLNNRDITVIDGALGDGSVSNVMWAGNRRQLKTMRLCEIIDRCGGHCDYLKVDCEGGEWAIRYDELLNVRRLVMEVHCLGRRISEMTSMLEHAGFKYDCVDTGVVGRKYGHLYLIDAIRR